MKPQKLLVLSKLPLAIYIPLINSLHPISCLINPSVELIGISFAFENSKLISNKSLIFIKPTFSKGLKILWFKVSSSLIIASS